jgi:hypothetical protein
MLIVPEFGDGKHHILIVHQIPVVSGIGRGLGGSFGGFLSLHRFRCHRLGGSGTGSVGSGSPPQAARENNMLKTSKISKICFIIIPPRGFFGAIIAQFVEKGKGLIYSNYSDKIRFR